MRIIDSLRSNIRFTALAVAVSFTVTGLTAVLSNGLLFAVYYLNEPLRRRPANKILLALALMDFLTGAVANSLSVSEQVIILTADCTHICVVQELKLSCIIFFTTATLVALSLSTLFRYVAVFHSFRYTEFVTNERVTKVLLALWLGLVVMVAAPRVLKARLHMRFFMRFRCDFGAILHTKPAPAYPARVFSRVSLRRSTAKIAGIGKKGVFKYYVITFFPIHAMLREKAFVQGRVGRVLYAKSHQKSHQKSHV